MSFKARPSTAAQHRPGVRPTSWLGTIVAATVAVCVWLAAPAAAAPLPAPTAPTAPASAAPAPASTAPSAVPVTSLAMTGTVTKVTVRRIHRRGQVQWINHVLATRLVDLDGCQARRSRADWSARTYRSTVRTVCADGAARAEAAARRLVADRPWYQVQVTHVPLVGFSLGADLPEGNDRAFPAALAKLPAGPFTFAEGDDLSVNYVGQGVTQAQLDAAVAAFANALGIPLGQVEVNPLAG